MRNDLHVLLAPMSTATHSVSPELAATIAHEAYALRGRAEPLTGERDENFRIVCADGSSYVLKVVAAREQPLAADLPVAALLHLEQADGDLPCPRVRRTRDGRPCARFEDANGQMRTAYVTTFMSGEPLRNAARSRQQRMACGRMAARIGRALSGFRHPAGRRGLIWDLRQLPKMHLLLSALPAFPERSLVEAFVTRFEANVAPRLPRLRQQMIHNDLNDRNILVDPQDGTKVTGVIDFGDMLHTALVADVAITCAEQITEPSTLRETVGDLVDAYQAVEPLQDAELGVLGALIGARIVMGVVIPSWHRMKNPSGGHYARVDESFIRQRLALLREVMTHG